MKVVLLVSILFFNLSAHAQIDMIGHRDKAVIGKEHWYREDYRKVKIDTVRVVSSGDKNDREFTEEIFIYNDSGQLQSYVRNYPNRILNLQSESYHSRPTHKGVYLKNTFIYKNSSLERILVTSNSNKHADSRGFGMYGSEFEKRVDKHFKNHPHPDYTKPYTYRITIESFTFTYDKKGNGKEQVITFGLYNDWNTAPVLFDTLIYSFHNPHHLFYTQASSSADLGYCKEDYLTDSTQWLSLPAYLPKPHKEFSVKIREINLDYGRKNYEFTDSHGRKRLVLGRNEKDSYLNTGVNVITYGKNGIAFIKHYGVSDLNSFLIRLGAIPDPVFKLPSIIPKTNQNCLAGNSSVILGKNKEEILLNNYTKHQFIYDERGLLNRIELIENKIRLPTKANPCITFEKGIYKNYKTWHY